MAAQANRYKPHIFTAAEREASKRSDRKWHRRRRMSWNKRALNVFVIPPKLPPLWHMLDF